MKRSITFAAALVTAFALSGCGAGLYSQTADQMPTVPGVNVSAPGPEGNGTVSVRNAMLAYPGVDGYKAGSQAPMRIWLFNDTEQAVRVVIKPGLETPITIPAGGYAKPDVKFPVSQDLDTAASVPVKVEFVGVHEFDMKLPIEPPTAPAEPHKIELETPAGEGH